MPRNALSNPIVLATLGALLERPSHAYGLATTLSEQGVPVNRGSLYDTLDAMAQAGWIQAGQPKQMGNRPKRITYTITDLGRRELARRLDVRLRSVHCEYLEFTSAIAHIGMLGKDGALEALTERRAQLDLLHREDRRKLEKAIENGVPRLFVLEAEYTVALLAAELSWTNDIIKDIEGNNISWSKAKQYHKEVIDGDSPGNGA